MLLRRVRAARTVRQSPPRCSGRQSGLTAPPLRFHSTEVPPPFLLSSCLSARDSSPVPASRCCACAAVRRLLEFCCGRGAEATPRQRRRGKGDTCRKGGGERGRIGGGGGVAPASPLPLTVSVRLSRCARAAGVGRVPDVHSTTCALLTDTPWPRTLALIQTGRALQLARHLHR